MYARHTTQRKAEVFAVCKSRKRSLQIKHTEQRTPACLALGSLSQDCIYSKQRAKSSCGWCTHATQPKGKQRFLLFANHESACFRSSTPNNPHLHVWLWVLPGLGIQEGRGKQCWAVHLVFVGHVCNHRQQLHAVNFLFLLGIIACTEDECTQSIFLLKWGIIAHTDDDCTQSTSFFCWASLHAQRTSARSQFSCFCGASLHTQTTIARSQIPFFVGHHCMHRGRVHAVNFLLLWGIIAHTDDDRTQSTSFFCWASLHAQRTSARSQSSCFSGASPSVSADMPHKIKQINCVHLSCVYALVLAVCTKYSKLTACTRPVCMHSSCVFAQETGKLAACTRPVCKHSSCVFAQEQAN